MTRVLIYLMMASAPFFSSVAGEDLDQALIQLRKAFVRIHYSELIEQGDAALSRPTPDFRTALTHYTQAKATISLWARHFNPWAIEGVNRVNKRLGTTHMSYAKALIQSVESVSANETNHPKLKKTLEQAKHHIEQAAYVDKTVLPEAKHLWITATTAKKRVNREWIQFIEAKETLARRQLQARVDRLIAEGDAARRTDPPDFPKAISRYVKAEKLLATGAK